MVWPLTPVSAQRDVSSAADGEMLTAITANLAVVRSTLEPGTCTCKRQYWLDYSRVRAETKAP